MGRRALSARQRPKRAGSASRRSPRTTASSIIIERDNQIGEAAKVKKLYRVSLDGFKPAALGGELPVVDEDAGARPHPRPRRPPTAMSSTRSKASPSTRPATPIVITDNDGVDDSSGETLFLRLGKIDRGELK